MRCALLGAIALAAAVVVPSAGALDSHPAPQIHLEAVARTAGDAPVRIDVRFASATRGTFRVSGAVVESGSLAATRRVSGGRLRLAEVLEGSAGTIRVSATHGCSSGRGTWRVVSGSRAYTGLTGEGAASGGPRCAAPRYPVRATYRGRMQVPPPPPLAQPGRFAGGTSQREEVVLDVLDGGRAIGALRFRVTTPCEGTTSTSAVLVSIPGPTQLGSDGSFSATSSSNSSTVSGRFTSLTSAEGTATATTQVTISATNTTYQCRADVTWRVSLPPPSATPGRYCGFTNQGPSICLDVDPTGRTVTKLEVGVVVLCFQQSTEFELRLTFTDAAIGGNLGFRKSVASFEGLVSGSGAVSGLIDLDGAGASGSVLLQLPVFDFEGTRYSCRNAGGRWTARRQ